MARVRLSDRVRVDGGEISTPAELLDEGRAVVSKVDKFRGPRGGVRVAYFVDLVDGSGSWEIGEKAYESRAAKGQAAENPRRGRCPVGMEVQSVLLPKDQFTKAQAKAWLKRQKPPFKTGQIDESDDFWRACQVEPEEFSFMRTIEFGDSGIKAVVGCPKVGAAKNPLLPETGVRGEPRDWTAAERELVIDAFAKLALAELRRRQDLAAAQIKLAYEQGKTEGLRNLQVIEDLLTEAVLRREFGG